MDCRRIHHLSVGHLWSSYKRPTLTKYLLAICVVFFALFIAKNLYAACCIGSEPLGSTCTPCGPMQTCDQITLTCKSIGGITACLDADGDGFTASSCGGKDCNDSNASINPNRAESCNGIDDDCSGTVDDNVTVPDDGNPCTDDICKNGQTYPAASASTICRASAGDCDKAEYCTGTSTVCPTDTFQSLTAVCRTSAGTCDIEEKCTGSGATCPSDSLRSATYTCRSSAGTCDTAEKCTGTSAECPADVLKPATYTCRSSGGTCDVAETCTGSSSTCPSDAKKSSGTLCRASVGACDIEEACTGTTSSCPTNKYQSAGTVCREAVSQCDAAETCSGKSGYCPSDKLAATGIACNDSNECTTGEACVSGACQGGTSVSSDDNNACTADSCDSSSGVVHTPITGGEKLTCGVGACANSADQCLNGVAQTCTPKTAGVEICNGIDDDCDGVTDEGFDTDGDGVTTCDGDCDDDFNSIYPGAVEKCDGLDNNCDGKTDESFPLKGAACSEGLGQCQNGIYLCSADGSSLYCKLDGNKANGSACDDNNKCTQTDICLAGKCAGSNPVKCSALDQCHDAGVCDASTGTCSNPVKTSGFDAEVCDGIDNDCDGVADDGLGNITCGVGECANSVLACINGQTQSCAPKTASAEVCDNKDNDCDGAIDDNADVLEIAGDECHYKQCQSGGSLVLKSKANGTTCNDGDGCSLQDSCQSGVCTGGVKADCSAEADQCNDATCTSTSDSAHQCGKSPKAGSCNADNNECTVSDACKNGTCTAGAQKTCAPSDACHEVGECIAEIGVCPKETVKNCDDGNACTADSCDLAIGCMHAVKECTTPPNTCYESSGTCGAGGCEYTLRSYVSGSEPTAEKCDGLDNDCDGKTDENYISTFSCGVGECFNSSECLNSKEVCIPNDDQKLDEMCDGMDNDCNGSVDDIADEAIAGEQCKVNRCVESEWQIVSKEGCVECIDDDGDGICADVDNCTLISNVAQDDFDKDGIGDACDEPDCGNGYLESGEACDDGNDNNSDLCRNDCSQPTCGDGIVDAVTNKECEAGVTALGAHQYCEQCLIKTEKYCGDENIDRPNAADFDEDCDGTALGGATCESLGHKGGGDVSCGADCAFVADCSDSLCGDGVRDEGEACDGVAGITDSIHQKCESCKIIDIPPVCGNGVVDGTEECDGGTDCRATCMLVKCGDGIQDTGEACDKGVANSDTGECLSTCQVAECGDGFIKDGVEECDNGMLNSDVLPDACRTSCMAARCSDGIVDSVETCDDGKSNGDDGKCNLSCTGQKKYCGDGIKDAPNDQGWNEECDGSDGVIEGKVCNISCMLDDCAGGDTRVCSTGLLGACVAGSETCESGKWGECSQSTQAVAEICNNGQDDDCDGLADGADSDCGECASGIVQACNITNEFGSCAGTKACGTDYKFGECGGRTPMQETCNSKDDDCDSRIDEDLNRACSNACGAGVETCQSGEWRGCSAPQPEAEKCDNKDNDCDGAIDENVKNACGACGEVPAEVCDDGKDNNCDGAIDEGCVPIDVKKNISAGVGGVLENKPSEDDRPEVAAMPVCTSKIFDCSKTRAIKLPNDVADIKVLDDGKLIVVIDSKGQMAAVEMKQFGEGAPKAPVAKGLAVEEKKEFKVECGDGKEVLIEMKKSAEAANGFAFEGALEACSVKSSEKSSVTINIGEKDIAIDVTKVGEIFGSEFNKSIGSGNFGVDETNIIVGGSDAIKIGKVDTAGNITALPEEDEKLAGCSETDKICNDDSLHFIDPKLTQSIVMKPFGGADLMALFTEEKSGEKYAFFYYNINEEPVVDAKPGENLGEFTAIGFDPTYDELFYIWSCKDSVGKECDNLLSTLEGAAVSVIAPAEGWSASGGSPEGEGAKQSPELPDVSLNAPIKSAEISAYQWPLTLTVTATDPGGMSASKSIQAMKSGEIKAIAEAVPALPTSEIPPPAESATPFIEGSSISGGGCGGFFSVGGVERMDVNRVIALLWPLVGSILILGVAGFSLRRVK